MSLLQTKTDNSTDMMKQLEKECRQNNLSLALLCMQKALLMSDSGMGADLTKNCVEVFTILFNFFGLTLFMSILCTHSGGAIDMSRSVVFNMLVVTVYACNFNTLKQFTTLLLLLMAFSS